jgi:hypothetical protein
MVGPNSTSCVVSMQSWTLQNLPNLKPTIYTLPYAISWEGDRETQNTQYGSTNCEDRRETMPEPLLVVPFDSIDIISFSTMIKKGVVQPLDMGTVEVTCIKLSLVLHRLESHELPIMIVIIFLLPIWWILCYWDDLWDAKIFLFVMYEYMYMLSHSCLLVLITLAC